MNTCKIPDCGKKELALGWCSMHYQRVWKYGFPDERPVRGRPKGFRHSPETKIKCGLANIGRKLSAEHTEKIRISNSGRKNTPETILKMRAAAVGRKSSIETRAKISEAQRGKEIPLEVREKISAALKGKPKSPEHAAKVGLAQRGIKRGTPSEDIRMKISAALTGRPRTPEVIEKIRQANLGAKSHFFGQPQCNPKGKGTRTLYQGIWFRSTWEARFAKALDARGLSWEYEQRRFDLGSCTYLPDFYLPETGAYWEVKGWFDSRSIKKVELFRSKHPEIPLVVVTGEILKMMEA